MLPDELEKLYDLYQQGAISAAEYEEVKQRLLQRNQRQTPEGLLGLDVKSYKALLHASQYVGHFAPVVGLIVPIILWSTARTAHPEVDAEGKHVLNWIISEILYIILVLVVAGGAALIGLVLGAASRRGEVASLMFFVGYGSLYAGLGLIALLGTVLPLVGVIRTLNGKSFRYPLAFRFLK